METEYRTIHAQNKARPFFKQTFLCVTASLCYFMTGLSFGSPTVIIPQLRKEANSTAAVSEEMASWIASIVSFGSLPWICVLIITAHYIGRKKPWHATAVVTLIAFTILYFSKNVMHVFISQFLLGITFGTQITISIMIITECASPRYRGLFLTLKTASFYWGIWIANAIGTFFNYRYIGILGILCSTYNLITIFFVPETPYWLAYQGRYDECAKAHRWLKGVDEEAEKELNALIQSQENNKISKHKKKSILLRCKNYFIIMIQPQFYKPVSLSLLILSMYYLSGKLVYAVYAVEMLKKITKDQTWAYNGMLILDGFSVFGMYIGCSCSKIFKRRSLLLSTSVIAAVLTYGMALYLYLVKLKVAQENNYVSITFLVVFSLAICCGPLILCGCITGELFPMKARSFGIIIISLISSSFLGIILKVAPYLFKAFDFHGTFLFFGIAFTTCIVIVYKYLPETKDKTLTEIAAIFEKMKTPVYNLPNSVLLQNDIENKE